MESEQKKTIFYFQFKQDFFESQEIRDITGLAEEAGDNPNDYIILYLKMISMSLAKDGYLISYNGQPLSAGLLRRVLKFETSGTVKDTIELIDRAVTKFKEIELLYHLKDGSIFIPRVKYLAMNKKEASEQMKLWRYKKAALEKESSHLKNQNIDEDDELDLAAEISFSGLLHRDFLSIEQKETFKTMITDFIIEEQFIASDLIDGTKIFLKNIMEKDISKISDRFNYFKVGLKKIIEETIPLKRMDDIKKQKMKEQMDIINYNWVKNND